MSKRLVGEKPNQMLKYLKSDPGNPGEIDGKLIEGEEIYRQLFEHAAFSIVLIDPENGRRVAFNRKAYEMRGYTKEEYQQLGTDMVLDMEREELLEANKKVIRNGPHVHESKHRTKNGEIDIFSSSVPIQIGSKYFIQIISYDITDQKQAEEELRKSEELYRSLVENIELGVTLVDSDHNIIMVNSAQARKFQKAPHEMIGEKCFREFEKRESVCPYCPGIIAIATNDASEIETEGVLNDGSRYDARIHAFPIFTHSGQASGFIEVVEDITERKESERALLESEEKLRTFMETASDLMYITDKDGKILYANTSMAKTLGYSKDEIIEMYITELCSRETQKRADKHILLGLKRKGEYSFETKWVSRDNHEIYGEIKVTPVYEGDIFIGSRGVFRDVTIRKKAEQELKEKELDLQDKAKTLEDMNAALRVLLKKRDEDKKGFEESVLSNVKELVLPYLAMLKNKQMDESQHLLINSLESNLNDVVSPFLTRLSSTFYNFTPQEIQVANFTKQGMTSKDIANLLSLSPRTIDRHRENIRKKLGIKNTKTNLRTHLMSLQ